jgi:uncharacterized membrane protein
MDETTKTKTIEEKKVTALGIDNNIEGALAYFFGLLTGILFLVLEKDDKFVKFHAVQSIIVSIAAMILLPIIGIMLMFIPVIGWLIYILLYLGMFALWLLLMFKAYQKEMFKLPIAGDIAAKQVGM